MFISIFNGSVKIEITKEEPIIFGLDRDAPHLSYKSRSCRFLTWTIYCSEFPLGQVLKRCEFNRQSKRFLSQHKTRKIGTILRGLFQCLIPPMSGIKYRRGNLVLLMHTVNTKIW
jgi:hypothetical protein